MRKGSVGRRRYCSLLLNILWKSISKCRLQRFCFWICFALLVTVSIVDDSAGYGDEADRVEQLVEECNDSESALK